MIVTVRVQGECNEFIEKYQLFFLLSYEITQARQTGENHRTNTL